jgi:hypothetical protein
MAGSNVLSSSTCTISGYWLASVVPGVVVFVDCHSRAASASEAMAGRCTLESRRLTKKLVSAASSDIFSHAPRACTCANGPDGSKHAQNASTQAAMPPTRNMACGSKPSFANSRRSKCHASHKTIGTAMPTQMPTL